MNHAVCSWSRAVADGGGDGIGYILLDNSGVDDGSRRNWAKSTSSGAVCDAGIAKGRP